MDQPPNKINPNLIPKLIKKGIVNIINYREKTIKNEGPGYTYYAIQHRVQRLLESDTRDKAQIIEEILLLFNLLPECIKRVFEMCSLDMQKVKQRCDSFYANFNHKCHLEKSDMKVVNLKCSENEDLINDTCV